MTSSCQCEQTIHKFFTLYKSSKRDKDQDPVIENTLVLFFGWLLAKQTAVEKYRELYLSRGFDVLFIRGVPTQYFWPPSGFHTMTELIQVLKKQLAHYKYFLAHGVSIGNYNYTLCLLKAAEMPEMYGDFTRKLKGYVADSIPYGSIHQCVDAVVQTLSKNTFIRSIIGGMFNGYLSMTHKHTVDFFDKSMDFYVREPAIVPTLLLTSRNDPFARPENVDHLSKRWMEEGEFYFLHKNWEKSVHAGHLLTHQEEYLQYFDKFLAVYKDFCLRQENSEPSKVCSKL